MTFRDRIRELRRVRAGDLRAHAQNWRKHSARQKKALQSVLSEIGWADAALARELPDGSLEIIDGHLRADLDPDAEIPVLVLDVNEEEAKKILATHDPLALMAGTDESLLSSLLAECDVQDQELSAFLKGLSSGDSFAVVGIPGDAPSATGEANLAEEKLTALEIKPPPAMTWVLVGIPTVRFGEISEVIEQIALLPGVLLETSTSDA